FGVVKALENIAQGFVVEVEAEREFVRCFVPAFLRLEVEEAGVVSGVGLLELLSKARVNTVTVDQRAKASVILDTTSFADAQKDDAVNNSLDSEVEFALGELWVAEREIPSQIGAPTFDCLQEFVVNVSGAALG